MTHPAFEEIPLEEIDASNVPDIADFEFLDLRKAIEQEPEPLDFVFPGLLAGTVGALVSPGETGKTMAMLQTAITLSGGADTLKLEGLGGWICQPGKVLFLSAEDPAEVLQQRVHALGAHVTREQRQAVYQNLQIAPLVGRGADLMNQGWASWIMQQSEGKRLVVIDTLRRFHVLDENDGGQMADLVGRLEILCRQAGTTVLFLHHTSKAGGMQSGDAQQASRGSSVLTDNARFQGNLVGMSQGEAKEFDVDESRRRFFVRLSFAKLNYSAPLPDQWYRRTEGGVLLPAQLGGVAAQGYVTKKKGRKNDTATY